jgi:hypothetical protein
MRRDFVVTRWAVFLFLVVGMGWVLGSWLAAPPSDPVATTAADAPVEAVALAPALASVEELADPDIQRLWSARRARLDSLSQAFRAESDPARAESLRHRMEQLIVRSEREVYEMRIAHARQAGHVDLARQLERALAGLPSPSLADSLATSPGRPGGTSP